MQICQILHVIFESTSQFSAKSSVSSNITPLQLKVYNIHWSKDSQATNSNFVSLFSVMKDKSSTFLAQTIYTLLKKSLLKGNFFETFKSSGQNLSNSSCQF